MVATHHEHTHKDAHYSLVGEDLKLFSQAGFDMEKIVRLSIPMSVDARST